MEIPSPNKIMLEAQYGEDKFGADLLAGYDLVRYLQYYRGEPIEVHWCNLPPGYRVENGYLVAKIVVDVLDFHLRKHNWKLWADNQKRCFYIDSLEYVEIEQDDEIKRPAILRFLDWLKVCLCIRR